MNPDEAVILARYVRALCPQQKFDEYTPDAWHDVLRSFTLAETRTAAATIAGRQAFVAPGEIATEARRTRATLVSADAETEAPTADPDDPAAYLTQLRTRRHNVATGRVQPRPALPTAIIQADVTAIRQQNDFAAYRQEIAREAAARCAARKASVARHPDLVDQVARILGHPNWNGFLAPEHDSSGRINNSPYRKALVAVIAEAEQRATGGQAVA